MQQTAVTDGVIETGCCVTKHEHFVLQKVPKILCFGNLFEIVSDNSFESELWSSDTAYN